MGGLRLGNVLGFEVRIDYSWFIVFVLIAWFLAVGVFPQAYNLPHTQSWGLGLLASILVFASVLVHELSHALVARRMGIEVGGITLFLFGGIAQIKGEPDTPREEFLVAVAGPTISIALGLVSWCASVVLTRMDVPEPPVALLNYLGWLNLALAAFNLVPGFPLDGGRLLRAAIWKGTGSIRRATKIAAGAGQCFAWVVIAFGSMKFLAGHVEGLWLVCVGLFLNHAARVSYEQMILRRALTGVPVTAVMSHELPVVDADLRIPQFVSDYLLHSSASLFPVARGERLVGVVTADDVRELDRDLWGVTCVGAIAHMPDQDHVLQDDQDAWAAFTQMIESDHARLLVLHDDRLEGDVSRDAVVRLADLNSRRGLAA